MGVGLAVAAGLVVALLVGTAWVGGWIPHAGSAGGLSQNLVSQPGGWQGESPRNAVWASGGLPVVFYEGSVACPYCGASNWPFLLALEQFGTLTGITYGYSNPNDVYPATPEVSLGTATYQSTYLSLDVKEGNVNTSTSQGMPSLSATESSYVNAYDQQGAIPLYFAGGMYFHLGSVFDPAVLSGLSDSQVQAILANASLNPSVYNAIHAEELYYEAYFVVSDQVAGITPPSSVTSQSAVMTIVDQIR